PSRYRFATFRLYGLARFSLATRAPAIREIALPIDRDQSNGEQYTVTFLVLATVASFIAVLLPLPAAVSIAIAIPLATFVVQVPILIVGGILPPGRHNAPVHGVLLMTMIAAASVWFAR